jgi:hypothetical protein
MIKGAGGKAPKAKGGKDTGKTCITKYFKELGLKAPEGVSRFAIPPVEMPGAPRTALLSKRKSVVSNLEARQACKANIFLFARGTTEPGVMGSTVGPALSGALSSKFSSVGISYTADVGGINCIGLPGGVKCRDQLAKLAAKCPTSAFFLGGYSQGAMVVRLCAAHSTDEVKKRIKVSYYPKFSINFRLVY